MQLDVVGLLETDLHVSEISINWLEEADRCAACCLRQPRPVSATLSVHYPQFSVDDLAQDESDA